MPPAVGGGVRRRVRPPSLLFVALFVLLFASLMLPAVFADAPPYGRMGVSAAGGFVDGASACAWTARGEARAAFGKAEEAPKERLYDPNACEFVQKRYAKCVPRDAAGAKARKHGPPPKAGFRVAYPQCPGGEAPWDRRSLFKKLARIEFLLGCAPANDAHEGRADAIARGAATLRQRRAKASATKADPRGVVPIDDATAARLEAQAKVQDSLTDDLVDLVSEFKTGAQEVQRRLGDRAMLLDETEEALEKSSAHAKQKVRGAKNLLETNAGGLGTCTMLLIVLGVLAVFTWVFVLIRFTSVKRIK